jgi:hypothetical protein
VRALDREDVAVIVDAAVAAGELCRNRCRERGEQEKRE